VKKSSLVIFLGFSWLKHLGELSHQVFWLKTISRRHSLFIIVYINCVHYQNDMPRLRTFFFKFCDKNHSRHNCVKCHHISTSMLEVFSSGFVLKNESGKPDQGVVVGS
jgi:hypothetical protein